MRIGQGAIGNVAISGAVQTERQMFTQRSHINPLTVGTTSARVVSASTDKQRKITVRAFDTNQGNLYFNFDGFSASVNTGVPLFPGEVREFFTNLEMDAISDGAASDGLWYDSEIIP